MPTLNALRRYPTARHLHLGLVSALIALGGCAQTGTQANRSVYSGRTAFTYPQPARENNGSDVQIGHRQYNTLTGNFDRPWPFGPVSND